MRTRTVGRRLLGLALLGGALLLFGAPVLAAELEIASEGPLTRVIVSDDLACQVAYRGDADFEFYPPGSTIGSCGTFVAVGGTVYGPLGGGPTQVGWTPVSQTGPLGGGTAADPFRIVTVVEAPDTGLRLEQTDTYVVGSQAFRTEMRVINGGTQPAAGVIYRAGDCYLQESDVGFGRVDRGAVACVTSRDPGSRIELWLPITPGSHYMEDHYSTVYAAISAGQQFPDTCACDTALDNGAGLSWPLNVAPGGTATIVHETFFSPVGRTPVSESFADSVPDPTRIILDPVIVAQSVAVTAGVILLVPFPSALFNATLEEHYDEIMAGVTRIRAAAAGLLGSLVTWGRGQLARRRAPTTGPPAAGDSAPEMAQAAAKVEVWRTPQGMLAFIAISALIYAFLDPTFGFSVESLATLAGLALGLLVVLVAHSVPLIVLARRHRVAFTMRALPATLLIGVACVVISRLADFQPGYLYGLIIGFVFAREGSNAVEGRADALAAASSLAVGVVAWIGLAVVRAGADASLAGVLAETALVTTVVASLEATIFAMLPLRFLPGQAVLAWNRRVWVVLMAISVFAFTHVLLNPTAGYLADTTRTSFLTMVLLLGGFGLASVGLWAWFRFRRPPRAEATPA